MAYVKRILLELASLGRLLGRPALDTIYLGGGTPSVLSQDSLCEISHAIHAEFDTADLQEATLEANPGTLTYDLLYAMRRARWDRVSLGVQTLDDDLLRRLGRIHNAAQGLDAVKLCRSAGFERISADLLLGVPGQRMGFVSEDATSLVESGVEHLSIYALDLDKECPMNLQIDSGALELPPDHLVAETYQALYEYLPSLGLMPYEISNYSRPSCHSKHNVRYWQRRPYLGLGPGAASNISNLRWTETEDISRWVDGGLEKDIQVLSESESLAEIPLLALRMSEGVNWFDLRNAAEAKGLLGLVQKWELELEPYIGNGMLVWEGNNIRLTGDGMMVSNQVFQVFV
jgi:oxygen-independent coproporphyrinogen-3 oxidase